MAVDQSKILSMLEGRTLEKENIAKMARMVESASDTEDKKKVMKHSVFFLGQLPLAGGTQVDLPMTRKLLYCNVPYDETEDVLRQLLESLTTQTLLIKKSDDRYEVNMKFEKSVVKARKIARAYRLEREKSFEGSLPAAKKMYQVGTRYYHDGCYEEAAASFMNAVNMAEYRMAYYSLATMYYEGKGVERSLTEALRYACCCIALDGKIADALAEEILKELQSA